MDEDDPFGIDRCAVADAVVECVQAGEAGLGDVGEAAPIYPLDTFSRA